MSTIYTLAGEAYDALESVTRDDGSTHIRTKDDAPEWITSLVYAAHGEFLPDDWRYEAINAALGWIHYDEPDMDTHEWAVYDAAHEWADSYVDVYTMARFTWLASHIHRQFYVEDAVTEFGLEPEFSLAATVGLGQYVEAREVFEAVAQALFDRAASAED